MPRRTRIVATLGPATDRPGVLEALLDAGLDVARINFSHGVSEEPAQRIRRLRELAQRRNRNVAVLADLPGPKLRALLQGPITLTAGATMAIGLKPDIHADIDLTEPEALGKLKAGERVLLDDGRLQAVVAGVSNHLATLKILVGGTLQPNKGVNLPDTDLDIPAVTERDRVAIGIALQAGADWFALSFVRDASAARELRAVLGRDDVPILAKIERPEAVAKSKEIIDAFDGIMVARGDLGVEIALEKVPHVQKKLIQQARSAGKPVITATDMLDSMRNNPRPTRAEVSDVANAVYDGTDAVMLSGETAVGNHPVETVLCMKRVLEEAEINQGEDGPRTVLVPRAQLLDYVTHAICKLAHEIGAEAIIAPSISGATVRLVARHRPKQTIIAITPDPAVARRLAVVWGVAAVPVPFNNETGHDLLEAAVQAAFRAGCVKAGALVVVSAWHPTVGGPGFPTIRVVRVGADGRSCEA